MSRTFRRSPISNTEGRLRSNRRPFEDKVAGDTICHECGEPTTLYFLCEGCAREEIEKEKEENGKH